MLREYRGSSHAAFLISPNSKWLSPGFMGLIVLRSRKAGKCAILNNTKGDIAYCKNYGRDDREYLLREHLLNGPGVKLAKTIRCLFYK